MGFCDQTLSVNIDATELCETVALIPSVGKKANYSVQGDPNQNLHFDHMHLRGIH